MNAPLASRVTAAMVLLATAGLPSAAAAQYRLPTIVSSVKADSLHEVAAKMVAEAAGATRPGCIGARPSSVRWRIPSGTSA